MFVVAYAFLYALALLQVGFYGELLPEKMATHFDIAGQPNGWMPKDAFIVFYLGFMFFLPGVMLAFGAAMTRLPDWMLSLPNRDYWLAPERRDATLKSLSSSFCLLGLMTGTLLAAIDQLVIDANLQSPPEINSNGVWVFLCAFAFFLISFLFWRLNRFRLPGKT